VNVRANRSAAADCAGAAPLAHVFSACDLSPFYRTQVVLQVFEMWGLYSYARTGATWQRAGSVSGWRRLPIEGVKRGPGAAGLLRACTRRGGSITARGPRLACRVSASERPIYVRKASVILGSIHLAKCLPFNSVQRLPSVNLDDGQMLAERCGCRALAGGNHSSDRQTPTRDSIRWKCRACCQVGMLRTWCGGQRRQRRAFHACDIGCFP